MPIKTSQARLTIPKDVWDDAQLESYFLDNNDFGFFITDDSRVVIMPVILRANFDFEFIGKCNFDDKHRFFIPKNVECYLGEGSIYYFSTSNLKSVVFLYKIDKSLCQKRQNLQLEILLSRI